MTVAECILAADYADADACRRLAALLAETGPVVLGPGWAAKFGHRRGVNPTGHSARVFAVAGPGGAPRLAVLVDAFLFSPLEPPAARVGSPDLLRFRDAAGIEVP
jgi:hypothetical protein